MARKKGDASTITTNSSLKMKVATARDFLERNREKGTLARKRRAVTHSLAYYVDRLQGRPRITKTKGVQYIGLRNLSDLEVRDIMRITASAHRRLHREVPSALFLVDVQQHMSTGKRKKYSIHLRLEGMHKVILSAKESDWDLSRALHKAIANLEQEVRHKFKREVTRRRRTFL